MNLLKSILITVFIGLMLSCTTVPPEKPFKSEPVYYSIPEIGVENKVFIGDFLLKEGYISSHEAIILKEDHGKLGWTAYHPAGTYRFIGKTGDTNIYQFNRKETNGWAMVYPQIIEEPNGLIYLKQTTGTKLLDKSEYSKRKVLEDNVNDFEQQLIYTGKEGTILKFTYREFVNDMARPSFTIDASYDSRDGSIIRFRGASLEIINVDNQSIRYRLLSGFKSN